MRDGSSTRKRLERCALTLFVKKGITATTIKDIAQKAEVAEGTLYRHYESKDELAKQLYLNAHAHISAQVKEIITPCHNMKEKIKLMVHFFCEKYDEDPILFNYLLLAQHEQIKALSEKEISAHDIVVSIFADAIRKKEMPKMDSQLCSVVLLGVLLQAAICRVYHRITRPMLDDVQVLNQAILHALQLG
ncbi:MAG: TetR/AcrR family transcriptional regulator [Candidatus Berkiella sp.]